MAIHFFLTIGHLTGHEYLHAADNSLDISFDRATFQHTVT